VARKPAGSGPRVAVIGGGFSGTAAGWMLAQLGATVTLYEASGRLGGRVWSQPDFTPGRTIEWGGELIGYNHPAWIFFAEAAQLGLSMLTTEDAYDALGLSMPMVLGGVPLGDDDQRKVYADMQMAFGLINGDAASIDPIQPWTSPNAAALDAMPLAQKLDGLSYTSPYSRVALEAQFANNNGASTDQQSYLANLALVAGAAQWDGDLMSFWNDSEVARCAQGNMALATTLGAAIHALQPGAVRMNAAVTSVNVSSGGVTVTARGVTDTFDYAILAVPPSVWGSVGITPALPPDYAPTMGTVVKFLSTVDSRFWLGPRIAPSGSDDSIGMVWEGTDNQIGSGGVELSLFAGGPVAVRAIQSGDPWGFYAAALDRDWTGYRSATSQGNTHFQNWEAQPFVMGGYSCPQPGEATTVWPNLFNGWQDRLLFAGEHASPGFFGYMEGALESGILAASRLTR